MWTDGVVAGRTPGESLQQVAARARRVIGRVAPVIEAGDDVALVAHGHLLRVLAACWSGLEPVAGAVLALDPGSISTLGFEQDRPVIRSWNVPANRPALAAASPTARPASA